MLDNHKNLFICLVLAFITIIAFEQVRLNDFISYDDEDYITGNTHIQEGLTAESVKWALTTRHAGNWHPLTWISHMLDCKFYKLKPAGHHITNLILHIINTLLLFGILKAMTKAVWPSAFVAVLFALHPLHVESVAWAAERKDILSGLFWMLTISAYIRYSNKPNIGRYILVVILFALGLMSKPMLVTLPFVLLLLDYWPLERFSIGSQNSVNTLSAGRLIAEKVPLLIMAAASCAVTFIAQQRGGAVAIAEALPLSLRISNALVSYIIYIGKMLYPSGLGVLYPLQLSGFPLWQPIVSGIILLAITAVMIYFSRKNKSLIFGWLWYIVTLVPVIGLVQVGSQSMADRYTYLPSIGIFIIVSWGVCQLSGRLKYRKVFLSVCGSAAIVVLTICTRLQVRHWKDSISLFNHTLAVTENNYVIHYNLGIALRKQGSVHEAIDHYRKALQINPNLAEVHYNLGNALQLQGKIDDALSQFHLSLKIKPEHAKSYYNIANILQSQGKPDEAVEYYRRAFEINPTYTKACYSLANALLKQGKSDQAMDCYILVLQIEPDHAHAHNNLANLLLSDGKVDQAIDHYSKALVSEPENAAVHLNISILLSQQGKNGPAIRHCRQALRINPKDKRAQDLLSTLLAKTDK